MVFKNIFFKNAMSKIRKKSKIENSVDDMLAEEMRTMAATNRTAEKLLKVRIMRQETNNTFQKIKELDDDNEEEFEEDDSDDIESQIKKMIFSKIIGSQPQAEKIEVVANKTTENNPEKQTLLDAVRDMSPEEITKIKKKFF